MATVSLDSPLCEVPCLILHSVVYRDVTRQAKGLHHLKYVGALERGLAYLSRCNSGWFCHISRGSLDEKLREIASTTTTLCLENPLVKPHPEQNPLEKMMYGSPSVLSEPVLFEVAKSATSEEYNSEEILHLCEDEISSSPSIEFQPLPASPEYIVLNHDRDPTIIIHDESLEMENPWAMEISEAPTLESEGKDSMDKHGRFILEVPQEPCSFNASPEPTMLCALSTYEDYNHLKVFSCKIFRRLVVDAYVYHKYCKFCGCFVALTLQLKLQQYINNWW
jgi:hypothetical protein